MIYYSKPEPSPLDSEILIIPDADMLDDEQLEDLATEILDSDGDITIPLDD